MVYADQPLKHGLYLALGILSWDNPVNPPIFDDLHLAFYLHSDEKGLCFAVGPASDRYLLDARVFDAQHPIGKSPSFSVLVELASFEGGDADSQTVKSKLNATLHGIQAEAAAIQTPGAKVGEWTVGVVKKLHARGLLSCPDTKLLEQELLEVWEKHCNERASTGPSIPVVKAKKCS